MKLLERTWAFLFLILNVQVISSIPTTFSYLPSGDGLQPKASNLASSVSESIVQWASDAANFGAKSAANNLASSVSESIVKWAPDAPNGDAKSAANNLASSVSESIVKWAPDAPNGDAKSAAYNLASSVSESIVQWAPDAPNGDAKSTANNLASSVSESIAQWAPDAANFGAKSAANNLASSVSESIVKWAPDAPNGDAKSTANNLASSVSESIVQWAPDAANFGAKSAANNLASSVSESIVKWAPDAPNGDAKSTANNLASSVSESIVQWAPDAPNGDAKSAANNLASGVSESIVKWARDAPNGDAKSAANNLASSVSESIVQWAPDAANFGAKSAAAQIKPQSPPAQNHPQNEHGMEDQNQTTSTERFSTLGIFHGFEDFSRNNRMLLGGYWGTVDPIGNLNCSLENVSICQVKSAVREHRQCFQYQDQDDILNYGSQLLNTNDIKLVKPDTKMYSLPFPNPFNVTVVRTTPLVGCQNNPITCHPMNSDGCLVYVCHVLYNTKAYQVTVKSDEINENVNMIAICHYETTQFLPTHAAFRLLHKHPGDIVCHFVGVTNYLMCTNDK